VGTRRVSSNGSDAIWVCARLGDRAQLQASIVSSKRARGAAGRVTLRSVSHGEGCRSREEFSKETRIRVSYLFRFIHKARLMPEWPGGRVRRRGVEKAKNEGAARKSPRRSNSPTSEVVMRRIRKVGVVVGFGLVSSICPIKFPGVAFYAIRSA